MANKYPTDPALIDEINTFLREHDLTQAEFRKILGIREVSAEYLSRYLRDKLDRKVENFEVLARDIMKNLGERIRFKTTIFDSSVVTSIANAFDVISDTGQIGFITGPAGHGKTSGIQRFCQKHPSAISIALHANGGSASKLESAIFSRIDTKGWNGRTSRFDFMAERFRDSARFIVLDNSQRLDSSGRNWMFDFHDATNSPIGCIGNPEALKPILANDQHARRLGMCTEYSLKPDEIPALARNVAVQFSDEETADSIADLLTTIASNDGALGSVALTVVLMQKLRNASAELRHNPRKALLAAHARLARTYKLSID